MYQKSLKTCKTSLELLYFKDLHLFLLRAITRAGQMRFCPGAPTFLKVLHFNFVYIYIVSRGEGKLLGTEGSVVVSASCQTLPPFSSHSCCSFHSFSWSCLEACIGWATAMDPRDNCIQPVSFSHLFPFPFPLQKLPLLFPVSFPFTWAAPHNLFPPPLTSLYDTMSASNFGKIHIGIYVEINHNSGRQAWGWGWGEERGGGGLAWGAT